MDITPMQQIISSASGAILTSLFVTPLDVIKIRIQSQATSQKCFLYCNGLMDHVCYCLNGNGNGNGQNVKWYKRPSNFKGTLHGMIQIAKNEGIVSLWSGLSPTLVMAIPATVMYYTIYDQLREHFALTWKSSLTDYAPVAAGALARGFSVTVISPLELIRTKMQSKKLPAREVKTVILSSIRLGGIRSLWMGLSPTLLRDVPFSMIYWYLYEQLKMRINHSSVFMKSFICGFTSGTIAGILTLPLDVVKTRRQIKLGELDALGLTSREGTSTLYVMKTIVRENGFRGLFAGLIPRCAKIAPGCAIMISSYELGKHFFRSKNERSNTEKISKQHLTNTTRKDVVCAPLIENSDVIKVDRWK